MNTHTDREDLIARLIMLGQIDATQTALFQTRAAARYGIGVTEMKALDILTREGAQSAGQLAKGLSLTSGAVTALIDRLDARGLARRAADPGDRRRVLVTADLGALARGENVYAAIGAAFVELYAGYTDDELAFLVRHFEASVAITVRETDALARRG